MTDSTLSVRKDVLIAADAATVFMALTDPVEFLKHFPYDSVTSDPRVGGEHVLRGRFNDLPFTDFGTIVEFERDRVFQYRYWSDNHGTERAPENELSIRYELTPESSGCRLTVTHGNLPSIEYRNSISQVWDVVLGQLREALDAYPASSTCPAHRI